MVDRYAPWRITGTPYSAARLTVGDLAARIADVPEQLPVLFYVPDFDCRDIAPLRSTTWDGALVLKSTPAEPDPAALLFDLDLPAPADTAEPGAPAPAGHRAQPGVLTVGDLAQVLVGLPDHAPVTALVPGWNGTDELVVDRADDYGTCLVLDTGFPSCDPCGPDDLEDADA
ncbi:hypothetical protein J5Y04_31270 [Kitasatospora sp. RG8]|uniref:hypothetical protein n=1 Tax=Kitasatospora sp. RG8 TaxID=2820815 RepID=UPI001AE0D74C|nr:hypothetical protein [Kitasatospora sp. RG8]MBP0453989.1 hypothetical protein [Kitasatospora sp. RG8]